MNERGIIMMNKFGIIMAGGGGTRFWPMSRQANPKQLLNLSGKDLMINDTINRLTGFIDKRDIFIVTNVVQAEKMKTSVVEGFDLNKILAEPSARNTAACVGYAAMEIMKKHGDGIMCIFPSDHFIKNEEAFTNTLLEAVKVAEESDKLVTIGITPTFPSTGYGYINYNREDKSVAKKVLKFVEKPNLEIAKSYLESGDYLWNSGMFIWKASTILKNFQKYLPNIYKDLETIAEAMNTPNERNVIEQVYPNIESISVDYGIMERSDDVVVLEGDFGWNDVGSWDALDSIYDTDENGNVLKGNQINIDTKNCISFGNKKLIATIGIENLIIVETDDALLICNKDKAQDVKAVVDILKEQNKKEYL